MIKLSSLPDAQLNSASHALGAGYPELAVIHAQTACEVATAQFMDRLLEKNKAPNPFPAWQVYDLASYNEKVRRVFERFTGEHLETMPWWTGLQKHTERRHAIVHGGMTITLEAARESYDTAREFVGYLTGLLARLGLPEFSSVRGPTP